MEVTGNDLDFGEVGGIFLITAGVVAEEDVVNVGGKVQEGGEDSTLLSVQGYAVLGVYPLDLLLHLDHPLSVHFLV